MGVTITRETLASGAVLEFIREEVRMNPGSGHTVLSENELARSLEHALLGWNGRHDLWVFGYGSLIWNPGFRFAEREVASVTGWRRRFCLWLRIGRGSPRHPGLMLALDSDPGGSCLGMAFRIRADEVRTELPLLWVREMAAGGYQAHWVDVDTAAGPVRALTFVANPAHPRYAGHIGEDRAAAVIATASGRLGTCADYLITTADHLSALGLRDEGLSTLAERVRSLREGD